MLPLEAYERVVAEERALVDELNESTCGRVKVSSPYLLILARKPEGS